MSVSTLLSLEIQLKIDHLPIVPDLARIADCVHHNQVTVLIGPTGSGKTTMVGLHLLKQGLASDKRIGVTQPRRLAVISLAEYVSTLYGCEVGQEVGYQVRFDDATMEGTKLKFMTDGILLQEAMADPLFERYSVLIFDEAHEQGLNTDIGLGLVKRALKQRPDLHLLIMSATIDTGRFSQYFDDAPILTVEGRVYPIETHYLQEREHQLAMRAFGEDGMYASLPALAAYKAKLVHQSAKPGHILIFMPGKKEISETIGYLEELHLPGLLPLAAHSEMDQAEQQRIFEETLERKVVVATNIAETSITIDGLAYVIDSGLIRHMIFDHKHGIGALKTIEHSKAGLKQREGRAGRTQAGTYLPLFTKQEYEYGRSQYSEYGVQKRAEFSTPEIQREDLSSAILRMITLGISDVANFEFMNPPARGAVKGAISTLETLGALDNAQRVTPLGEQMSHLPVEPRIARMILQAEQFGCVDDILTIAACLSTGTIFTRPIGYEDQADAARESFVDPQGDLFTLLKLVPLFEKQSHKGEWAQRYYLNLHILEEIIKIRDQLRSLIDWMNISRSTLRDSYVGFGHKQQRREKYEHISKAITAGLLQNLAVRTTGREYARADGGTMRIHPGSVWSRICPPLIVCTEVIELNGNTFAVNCQAVEFAWLMEIAPHLLKTRNEPLTHPWHGHKVGTYAIIYLNGIEIGRKYQKNADAMLHKSLEDSQMHRSSEHQDRKSQKKNRHRDKPRNRKGRK